MNNNILELISQFLGNQNKHSPQHTINPSASSYPPEAEFPTHNNHSEQNNQFANILSLLGGNNSLSALSSLLGTSNPLASIASNKKEEETPSSPKDEIIL